MTDLSFSQMSGKSGKRGGGKKGQNKNTETKTPSPFFGNSFITRHQYVFKNGIDRQYKNETNPLASNETHLEDGKTVFFEKCVECHGDKGKGNGIRTEYMDPKPTDLTRNIQLPVSADAYNYWSIALGGVRFNTRMPPFKKTIGLSKLDRPLSDQQIWKVVMVVQNLKSNSALERLKPEKENFKEKQTDKRNRRNRKPARDSFPIE